MRPGFPRTRRHFLLSLAALGASPVLAPNRVLGANQPEGDWPRRFQNADGTATELPAAPARILSTSVTATGTLLAIDAPVAASASAANGKFFSQWEATARERSVENIWPAGRVDLEAVYAVSPDLIVVSATGADSARDHLARLRAVAPTIVVDYGRQSWQELARDLGQATGLAAHAQRRITEFDRHVADIKGNLILPRGQVNLISYNGPGASNPIATRDGVHGQLLRALGFDVEAPNPRWHGTADPSSDFIWAAYEFLPELRAGTTFLLRTDDAGVAEMLRDPMLANMPSVRAGQVYALGPNAFRIDYYSATEVVDRIQRLFGR
ncbi:Ferrienterobactin-binding periplasmic protein FepB (TC 3.A.1.14.2) [plant metagenome]|uniref:Ferrienterobactin-binding periplasmic protein FepB (TC 3.A.1.14.2) n=1 Tax=plant metagenome TaxID=1297885 RepID=A0A484T704_9ZZZZ